MAKARCRKCKNEKTRAPVVNGIAWVVPKGSPSAKPRPVFVGSRVSQTSRESDHQKQDEPKS